MSGAEPPLIVAIDGPSGVGKSTAARGLARRLGVPYLDTGAMYRAVALKVLQSGVDAYDQEAVEALTAGIDLRLERPAEGGEEIQLLLDGEPVGERIRTPQVGAASSTVAAYAGVRQHLVALQRDGAGRFGAVVEGRDIGTRVFPDTPFKFFLDARPEVRYRRRFEELRQAGRDVTYTEVEQEMGTRDERDAHRSDSPLTYDETYTALDTSERTADEVVEAMLAAIRRRGGATGTGD